MKHTFFSNARRLLNISILSILALSLPIFSAHGEVKSADSAPTHVESKETESSVSEEEGAAAHESVESNETEHPDQQHPINGLVWFFCAFFAAGILVLIFT